MQVTSEARVQEQHAAAHVRREADPPEAGGEGESHGRRRRRQGNGGRLIHFGVVDLVGHLASGKHDCGLRKGVGWVTDAPFLSPRRLMARNEGND